MEVDKGLLIRWSFVRNLDKFFQKKQVSICRAFSVLCGEEALGTCQAGLPVRIVANSVTHVEQQGLELGMKKQFVQGEYFYINFTPFTQKTRLHLGTRKQHFSDFFCTRYYNSIKHKSILLKSKAWRDVLLVCKAHMKMGMNFQTELGGC